MQPEIHAQHMVNLIDHGMNVQMTTDAARFTHGQSSNVLSMEANLYGLVGSALQARGHDVQPVNGSAVGGYQGILFTLDPSLPAPSFGPESIAEDHPVNEFTVRDPITAKTARLQAGRSQASSVRGRR